MNEPTTNLSLSFDNPPVQETRIGLQFTPLTGFRIGHFGMLWDECFGKSDWLIREDAPASPKLTERFGSKFLKPPESAGGQPSFPQVCMRLARNDGKRTAQFQPNKLTYGWTREEEKRPSYTTVRQEFAEIIAKFIDFVARWKLGKVVNNLWELTYVNKIVLGDSWQKPADWHLIMPGIFPVGGPQVAGHPWATFNGTWFFEIPPEKGRVQVRAQKVVENQTEEISLLLVITARGEINEKDDWLPLLDLGHQSVLRVFHDISSLEARKKWGIIHEQ